MAAGNFQGQQIDDGDRSRRTRTLQISLKSNPEREGYRADAACKLFLPATCLSQSSLVSEGDVGTPERVQQRTVDQIVGRVVMVGAHRFMIRPRACVTALATTAAAEGE